MHNDYSRTWSTSAGIPNTSLAWTVSLLGTGMRQGGGSVNMERKERKKKNKNPEFRRTELSLSHQLSHLSFITILGSITPL
jgi:hypothetical protein